MAGNGHNGYAGLPAILLAGAFLLPLLSRAVERLSWPVEFRVLIPLVLGGLVLAVVGPWRLGRLEADGSKQDESMLVGIDDVEA